MACSSSKLFRVFRWNVDSVALDGDFGVFGCFAACTGDAEGVEGPRKDAKRLICIRTGNRRTRRSKQISVTYRTGSWQQPPKQTTLISKTSHLLIPPSVQKTSQLAEDGQKTQEQNTSQGWCQCCCHRVFQWRPKILHNKTWASRFLDNSTCAGCSKSYGAQYCE